MRPWSRTAVAALLVASSIAAHRGVAAATNQEPAGDDKAASKTPVPIPVVQLELVIAGLTAQGCDVEIKPGNASCKFKVARDKGSPAKVHVASHGRAKVELQDVELGGADRLCTVAVTVHEAGQPPKTIYRGFRLGARPRSAKTAPLITCYLSSPSKLARSGGADSRR